MRWSKRFTKSQKKNRGAILLDAMIGMYLLAIAGIVFAATIGTACVSCAKANETTIATSVINRHLESIKNLGYGNLTYSTLLYYSLIDASPTTAPYSFTNVGASTEKISKLLPSGTGTVSVSNINTTLRRVTVTVSWVSRSKNKTVTASTELALIK